MLTREHVERCCDNVRDTGGLHWEAQELRVTDAALRAEPARLKGEIDTLDELVKGLRAEVEGLRQELAVAKCGEALCGHDHTTQYWELRENKVRGEVTDLTTQLTAMTQERDALRRHHQKTQEALGICGGVFGSPAYHITILKQQLAASENRVTALEEALKAIQGEVADCVDELHEQVLYPMNEGEMHPIKLDVCLAQLTQAVEAIVAQHALAHKESSNESK